MTTSLLLLTFTALGLLGALALFFSLKREMAERARRDRSHFEAVLARLEEARPAITPVPIRSGVNLSKRAQIMHLLREGMDAAGVSAALGVSRREVELLLRVNTLARIKAAGAD